MLSQFEAIASELAREVEPRLIDGRAFVNLIEDEHEVGKFIANPAGA